MPNRYFEHDVEYEPAANAALDQTYRAQAAAYQQPNARPSAPRRPGLLEVARLQAEAWLTERACDAEARILQAHLKVRQAEFALAEGEIEGRRRILKAALQLCEEEHEYRVLSTVRSVPSHQARQILGAELETERLLLEREQVRRHRLTGIAPQASRPSQ